MCKTTLFSILRWFFYRLDLPRNIIDRPGMVHYWNSLLIFTCGAVTGFLLHGVLWPGHESAQGNLAHRGEDRSFKTVLAQRNNLSRLFNEKLLQLGSLMCRCLKSDVS